MQKVIATVRLVTDAIAKAVKRSAAAAADGVVPTAGVCDDSKEWCQPHAVKDGAGGEEDAAGIDLHRVGRGIAVRRVVRVVAEKIHRLLSLEVDDAHRLSSVEPAAPASA